MTQRNIILKRNSVKVVICQLIDVNGKGPGLCDLAPSTSTSAKTMNYYVRALISSLMYIQPLPVHFLFIPSPALSYKNGLYYSSKSNCNISHQLTDEVKLTFYTHFGALLLIRIRQDRM